MSSEQEIRLTKLLATLQGSPQRMREFEKVATVAIATSQRARAVPTTKRVGEFAEAVKRLMSGIAALDSEFGKLTTETPIAWSVTAGADGKVHLHASGSGFEMGDPLDPAAALSLADQLARAADQIGKRDEAA